MIMMMEVYSSIRTGKFTSNLHYAHKKDKNAKMINIMSHLTCTYSSLKT